MPNSYDYSLINNNQPGRPGGILRNLPPIPAPTPTPTPTRPTSSLLSGQAPRKPIFSTPIPKELPPGVANRSPAAPDGSGNWWSRSGKEGQNAILRSLLTAGNIMQRGADPEGRYAATNVFEGIEGGLNTYDTIRNSQKLRKRQELERAGFEAAAEETTPEGRYKATLTQAIRSGDPSLIRAAGSIRPETEVAVESKSSLADLKFKHDKELLGLKESYTSARSISGTVLDQAAADKEFTRKKELLETRQGKEDARLKLKMDASKKQFDKEFSLKQKESLAKIANKAGKDLTAEEKILQHQKITSGAYKQAVAEADKEFPDIVPRMITFAGATMANPMFNEVKHGEQYDDYLAFIETRATEGRGETGTGTIGPASKYREGAPQFNQAYIDAMQADNENIKMDEIIQDYNKRFK